MLQLNILWTKISNIIDEQIKANSSMNSVGYNSTVYAQLESQECEHGNF